MTELQVKHSTPPSRCEICHQADRYNSTLNHCYRCANIEPVKVTGSGKANTIDPTLVLPPTLLAEAKNETPPAARKIPVITAFLGVVLAISYLGDLRGQSLAGFLSFGLFIGVIIGIAIIAMIIVIKKIYQAALPLSSDATMLRYYEWKANQQRQPARENSRARNIKS